MHRSPNGKDINSDNSLFNTPRVAILDEKQWLYVQKRYHMSPRELQVAKLVCQGFRNEEIARELKIRHGTVKTHLRNVYRRAHVKNKVAMLLKFVDVVVKFSAKPKVTPPIPIVDMEKPRKRAAAPTQTPKKKK